MPSCVALAVDRGARRDHEPLGARQQPLPLAGVEVGEERAARERAPLVRGEILFADGHPGDASLLGGKILLRRACAR